MNPSTYYIPVNYTDAGKVFGLFETRNTVEAVVLGIPTLFLCIAFLSFPLTAKIVVTLTLLVPVVGFGLIGLADDSLTRYLRVWWNWHAKRAVLTYRGEVDSYGLKRSDIRRWR